MLFKTHLMFGMSLFFLVYHFIDVPIWVLGFVLIGAGFVDIDVRGSKFGKMWCFRPFQFIVRHRGIFHSVFFALLLSLLIASINKWIGFGFFVGYVSHLLMDCFTRSGVVLFWPFSFKIKGFVKSGGVLEDMVFVLLLFGNIFIVGKFIFESLF